MSFNVSKLETGKRTYYLLPIMNAWK